MKIAFEVIKVILPAIISGIFTFFITKYTYNRNISIEKLEIAYNRVYYPLYRIISNGNTNNIGEIIDKINIYFKKYDKYIDISTKRLFVQLSKSDSATKRKSIYQCFEENIKNRNSYLRKRLGYLEPSLIQIYKFSTASVKSGYRIAIEIYLIYICLVLCSATVSISRKNIIYLISLSIFSVLLIILICEIIWCIFRTIYYRIKK